MKQLVYFFASSFLLPAVLLCCVLVSSLLFYRCTLIQVKSPILWSQVTLRCFSFYYKYVFYCASQCVLFLPLLSHSVYHWLIRIRFIRYQLRQQSLNHSVTQRFSVSDFDLHLLLESKTWVKFTALLERRVVSFFSLSLVFSVVPTVERSFSLSIAPFSLTVQFYWYTSIHPFWLVSSSFFFFFFFFLSRSFFSLLFSHVPLIFILPTAFLPCLYVLQYTCNMVTCILIHTNI